ncbi:MAG: matrixin family metalloprotease [Myxococcota bacterium]
MLAAVLAACAAERSAFPEQPADRPEYRPDRLSYAAFQAAHPELLEPNYLPFMVHRIPRDDPRGAAMVFCRWDEQGMPLSIYVATPVIPEELEDEFEPADPASYVAAVVAALDMWERDLEGLVRFRLVASPEEADISLNLIAAAARTPDPEVKVLGTTPFAGACASRGIRSGSTAHEVEFSVPRADLYIADEYGLLLPDQVQWIALHEIGHALGMRRHSPIPADLMYEVVRDRVVVSGLSTEDVNSFVSLYQLENGTVFTHLPHDEAAAPSSARIPPSSGPPKLALAPYVDPRHGFQVKPPLGWMRIETPRGMVAADGVSWDYSASFQVIVERYATIEEYLDRFAIHYLSRGRLVGWEFETFRGLRALRVSLVTHDDATVEQNLFIEVGDGRVVIVITDCATEDSGGYAPWFEAALASLEIWEAPGAGESAGQVDP